MRGQTSIEYLSIIILSLAIIVPAFYIAYSNSADEIRVTQARKLVNDVVDGADYALVLGPGTLTKKSVFVPDGTTMKIQGKTVIADLTTQAGESQIFANSLAILAGSLPSNSGSYEVSFRVLDNKTVELSLDT
ncbi:MAG: hypothetical protein ABH803_00085 [Candidatus Micrarchaeota archaeon]